MKITEAIVLAGGLGTRLRSAVPDLPKCMAPVNGKPFLSYVINHLSGQGISRFIFSLGYKHELIIPWLQESYPNLDIETVIEDEPLGTGGAIRFAITKSKTANVLALNGDTLFSIDLRQSAALHEAQKADCTLSLKPMRNINRYGVVEIDEHQRVTSFKEKNYYENGLINGGVYVLNRERFENCPLPAVCSFEKDYLEKYYTSRPIYGSAQDAYFIDIGIPEDFARANLELK